MASGGHEQIETDVVVVGSGGAGGEAAIHAKKGGARVLILDRGTFGRSGGTITAGHTCTAAVGDDDSPELHFHDTVIGGYCTADQRLVEIYANEAPPTLHELDEWGGGQTFRKDEKGKFDLVWPPGGHSRKRSVHYGFMTGPRIMWALRREIKKLDIPWMENILVTSILTHEGRVGGVAALDWKTGEYVTVKAKAIVLAAGGYAMLWPFRYSTNTVETAGDVHGMAYEAGAEMVDMEFIQFVPTQADPRLTHINPTLTNFPGWRPKLREHGKFTNSKGEDFLAAYDDVRRVIDAQRGKRVFGLSMVLARGQTVFVADTTVHELPSSVEMADIAVQTAEVARRLGHEPRVAMLSYSNFGDPGWPTADRVREAVALMDSRVTDFEYDGEMSADVALNPDLKEVYPFSRLSGPANVLVMPALHSANISSKLLQELGGGTVIGPILVGLSKPVQIAAMGASVGDLVNMAALAAHEAARR